MDYTGQLGALGERSVIRVLSERRFSTAFSLRKEDKGKAAALKSYKIYGTDEDLQQKEVDLIEEWMGADGVKHVKAHEVKCENDTLNFYKNGRLDKKSVDTLEAICKAGVRYTDGWKPMPTGNFFIELVQGCAIKDKDTYKARLRGKGYFDAKKIVPRDLWGWALVALDEEDNVKARLSKDGAIYEGRDIWFVSYTPKPEPDKITMEDPQTGERIYVIDPEDPERKRKTDKIDLNRGRQPERGFMLTQLPLDRLYEYLTLEFDNKLPLMDSKKSNKASIGLLFPFGKIYPEVPIDEDGTILTGYTDAKSGATLYNDLGVWATEKKDTGDNWTRADFEIKPFVWPSI